MGDITLLLRRIEEGDAQAAQELMALVYRELRRLAAGKMARDVAAHTLQPTALVHEAWLRLGGDRQPGWENRRHFFAAAASAMQQILVERARRRKAVRHGGGQVRVAIDSLDGVADRDEDTSVLAVGEILERFAALDPAKAELVKLRYFVGLTIEEAADALEISAPTAKRWWAFARAWLGRELRAAG